MARTHGAGTGIIAMRGRSEERKAFFFEKKKQKTFVYEDMLCGSARAGK
jgi:hypothetical protein